MTTAEGTFPKIGGDPLYASEINDIYQVIPPIGSFDNVIQYKDSITNISTSTNFVPPITSSGIFYVVRPFNATSGTQNYYRPMGRYIAGSNWGGSIVLNESNTNAFWFESNDYTNYCSGATFISGGTGSLNFIDGNTSSVYSDSSDGSLVTVWELDLGSVITCEEVGYKSQAHGGLGVSTSTAVDISTDGASYYNIYYKEASNGSPNIEFPITPGSDVRYIRVRAGSNYAGGWNGHFYELYVWGLKD